MIKKKQLKKKKKAEDALEFVTKWREGFYSVLLYLVLIPFVNTCYFYGNLFIYGTCKMFSRFKD